MNIPRLLPLAGVAIVGVLAVKLVSGVDQVQDLFTGAKAYAEEAIGKGKGAKSGADPATSSLIAGAPTPTPAKPAAVCAPTAAELAKEAGLSPAELQQLQNLGARREQLDAREAGYDTQIQLLAAAEAKVAARLKEMAALKGDITGLLHQVDSQQQVEVDRMVAVFQAMKPAAAAQRMVLLDDSVRLPIAAKMKERALSAILAQMPPLEAKRLTESLSKRFAGPRAQAAAALAPPPAAPATAPAPAQAAAAPPLAGAGAAPAKAGDQAAATPPKPARTAAATPKKKPAARPRAQAKAPAPKAPASAPAATPAVAQSTPSPAASAAAAGDTAKAPPTAPAK